MSKLAAFLRRGAPAALAALLLFTLAACGRRAPAPAPASAASAGEGAAAAPAEEPSVPDSSGSETEPAEKDASSAADEAWKQAFEESLWENYGVVPDHYEDLGDGVYQVYVEIDGKVVPYVAVDSATGDYHG